MYLKIGTLPDGNNPYLEYSYFLDNFQKGILKSREEYMGTDALTKTLSTDDAISIFEQLKASV